jgi:hypothetical protein
MRILLLLFLVGCSSNNYIVGKIDGYSDYQEQYACYYDVSFFHKRVLFCNTKEECEKKCEKAKEDNL